MLHSQEGLQGFDLDVLVATMTKLGEEPAPRKRKNFRKRPAAESEETDAQDSFDVGVIQ